MSYPPKAESVDINGASDGFVPMLAFQPEVLQGGYTRLAISTPADRLGHVHQMLVGAMTPPLKVRYVKMTDRSRGQLPKPESLIAVELSRERVLDALKACSRLLYHDGRNQLWIQGAIDSEQLVLEEIGMIYSYPDDFAFRDVLTNAGFIEAAHESLASRDYIKVNFLAEADAEEVDFIRRLALIAWQ